MESYKWCAVGLSNMDNISNTPEPPSCTLFNKEIIKCVIDYLVYGIGLFVSLYNSYCIVKMKHKQKLDAQSIQSLQQKSVDYENSSSNTKNPSLHKEFMETFEKSL